MGCNKAGHRYQCDCDHEEDENEKTVSKSASVVGYDEIIGAIKNAPLTQLPAILMQTVETCIERNIFVSGDRLVDVVGKVVKKTES